MKLFEIASGDIDPFYLHAIYQADQIVGVVTSGAYGHRTKKSIALGYLTDRAVVKEGDFEIEIIGERYSAKILQQPPYDAINCLQQSD